MLRVLEPPPQLLPNRMGFFLFGTFIPYYGFCIVVGIGCAFLLGYFLCKKLSLNVDDFILLDAYMVAFGFLGAKLLYIVVSFRTIDFSLVFHSLANFNAFVASGFVFYGGLLGGLAALPLVKKMHHLDVSAYILVLVPCLSLAHAFGRVGCSLAGCCYGKITDGNLYFLYHKSAVAPNDVRLFPVQGIESSCLVILTVIFTFLVLRNHFRKVHVVYIVSYSVIRFFLEFFRGDAERGIFGFLSTSQIVSLLLILGVISFEFLTSILKTRPRIISS